MTSIDWSIVQPAATAITALLVVWIAYRQFRLARDKVRLDLYQRRFAIYEKTITFYQALVAETEPHHSEEFSRLFREFITACRESQFLFEPSAGIFKLLQEFHSRAFIVIGFRKHSREISQTDPFAFQKQQQAVEESFGFLHTGISLLEQSIAPYLNFRRALA